MSFKSVIILILSIELIEFGMCYRDKCTGETNGVQKCQQLAGGNIFLTCAVNRWVLKACPAGTSCMTHPMANDRILCNNDIRTCKTSEPLSQRCSSNTQFETCVNGNFLYFYSIKKFKMSQI